MINAHALRNAKAVTAGATGDPAEARFALLQEIPEHVLDFALALTETARTVHLEQMSWALAAD